MLDIIGKVAKKAAAGMAPGRGRGGAMLGERLGARHGAALRELHRKSKSMSGKAPPGSRPEQKVPDTIKPPGKATSTTTDQALDQLGALSKKTMDQVGQRVEKSGATLSESAEALGTDVVSALKELEKSLVSARTPRPPSQATAASDQQPEETGQTSDGEAAPEDKRSGVTSLLRKLAPYAPYAAAAGKAGLIGGAMGLVESLGDTPGDTFEDQVANQKQAREQLQKGLGKIGSFFGSLFSAHGWVRDKSQTTQAKTIDFKAKRMEFNFSKVSGAASGGSRPSGIVGGADDSEDEGIVEQSYPGSGQRPEDSGGDASSPARPAQKEAAVSDVIQGPGKRKMEPLSPAGVSFSNPMQDPASRGLSGGKVKTDSLLPADQVKDFWKERNPNGAQIYGKDGKPVVNEQLLHSEAAGIKAFEAAHPEYRVEMYGPSSGERHSGSIANHGDQADGKGGALDVVIIDKKTGLKLTNHPGANHQNQGTVGENAPIYQELFNSTVSAAAKLYPGTEDKYRYGGYFSTGSNAMDLMHTDIRSREAPMGGGSRTGGFTDAQKRAWNIQGNNPYVPGQVDFGQSVPSGSVTTSKVPGSPWKNPGFGAQVQPQGSFSAPPADDEPRPRVVVKGGKDSSDSGKGDRVRKKKFRQTGGDTGATAVEKVRFSQYLNVENDEGNDG